MVVALPALFPCFSTGFPNEISSTQLLNGSRPYRTIRATFPFSLRAATVILPSAGAILVLSFVDSVSFSSRSILIACPVVFSHFLAPRSSVSVILCSGRPPFSDYDLTHLSHFGWRLLSLHPITNPARSSACSRTSYPLGSSLSSVSQIHVISWLGSKSCQHVHSPLRDLSVISSSALSPCSFNGVSHRGS
jgi:hypothetical protein